MEDINNCEILEFENQKFNLKVGFDDDSKFDNLKTILDNIDLNNITPLEALNKLCELKLLVNKI